MNLAPRPRHRSNSFTKTQGNSIGNIEPTNLNDIEQVLRGDNILRGNKAYRRSAPIQQNDTIPRAVGKYVLRTTIGEGSHSIYKLAAPANEPSKKLACKVIEKMKCSAEPSFQNLFEKEMRTLSQLQNPFIINLIDFMSDNHRYYVFFEYCPRTLLDVLLKSGPLSELNAARLFKQIIQGVKYIHDSNIVHRDLKLENILISTDYNTELKSGPSSPVNSSPVSSFNSPSLFKAGSASMIPPPSTSNIIGIPKISSFLYSKSINMEENDGLVSTPCGSPNYASPETLSGKPYDAKISDMWSLGVILYTMVVGSLPWTAKQAPAMFDQIKKGQYKIPSHISEKCKNLISSLLCVNVTKRIKIDQVLNHPFIKMAKYPKYLTPNGVPLSYSSSLPASPVSLLEKSVFDLQSSSPELAEVEIENEDPSLSPKGNKIEPRKKRAHIPRPKRASTSVAINVNNYL
ncbi:hypothetical protein M9Y10_037383 [Tritrichomonas musculus]|uniref:Protein kinase domain-containing protein n=1 Tax=Tritrichomonas musculus TaxID=1915356 RepID=A0ABR2GSG8_9EUKA